MTYRPSWRRRGGVRPPHRRLDWMAPATKAKAKAKLATLKSAWRIRTRGGTTAGLEVVRGDALGNDERAELFEYRRNLAKLGKPVDRGEWAMLAADRQRGEPPAAERAQLPGRDPRAAVLRPRNATAAVKYAAHRRDHRPRDQPQL